MRLFIILLIVFNTTLAWSAVNSDIREGNRLYKQGKLEDSIHSYERALDQNPNSDLAEYNLGSVLYKNKDYDKAIEHLDKAAKSTDVHLKPLAQYNLANALYKEGLSKENTNLDQAIGHLEQSLSNLNQAIEEAPKDADAQFNKEIVSKQLHRLKKKQQQQKQKQKDQQQNQNKDQNKNQKQNDQQKNDQEKNNQNNKDNQDQQNKQQQSSQDQQQKQNEDQQQNNKEKQEKDKDEQNQKDSQDKKQDEQEQGEDQSDQQQNAAKDQADILLEDYERNEQPKKLLNFVPKPSDDRPVSKDW